jgi:hypothetical protein
MVNMTDNLIIKNEVREYEKRTYTDLSYEFRTLYASAVRLFELIKHMYNRLTLVEKLSHKEAVSKIYNDHKHLDGFSQRNIRRNLPLDNPRRVRTSWPKNSVTGANEPSKLSNTTQEQTENLNEQFKYDTPDADNNSSIVATKSAAQPAVRSSCKLQHAGNHELNEAVDNASKLTTHDRVVLSAAAASSLDCCQNRDTQCDILEFEFYLSKIGRINLQRADSDNRGDIQNDLL